ncbi:MAG: hypothetical protein ICCCNLDF_00912 [Planctomycetes bacterium]|nr:hypothetical protein [Planctomycetota bacterium]
MTRTLPALILLAALMAACKAPEPQPAGGQAAGMVIGSRFDETPLTVGKGELEGKAVVISYFATW